MSLLLSHILNIFGLPPLPDRQETLIHAVTSDSRDVRPGTVFFAFVGTKIDGRQFIPMAIAQGAVAVFVPEEYPLLAPVSDCPLIYAKNLRSLFARIAALVAGDFPPTLVAITGTNGKTSSTDFVRQLWTLQNIKAAGIGTLGLTGVSFNDISLPSLTTPDPVCLTHALAALENRDIHHVVLEASSHGLEQHRLDGIHLTAAGITNLTRDHLDYHGTIAAYRTAKLRLFEQCLPQGSLAVANADMDEETLSALQSITHKRGQHLRLIGERGDALRLLACLPTPTGQELTLECYGQKQHAFFPLLGRFQVDNILTAIALVALTEDDLLTTLSLLPKIQGVRGRMERITTLSNGACVYVDYAHTPDAITRLLASLRPHVHGKLILVFGAGGDRDSGKRALMGEAATQGADTIIITDDNPRTENPAIIRAAIRTSAPHAYEIPDRRTAIAEAMSLSQSGDLVVVAGKGHEQGQIIGTDILPFDDAQTIRTLAGN